MTDRPVAELPINDVTTFDNASHHGEKMLNLDLLAEAPEPNAQRPRPAVKRVLSADGGNLILFTFNAGQSLPDHKAAHPITVQTLRGEVLFTCEGKEVLLRPGQIIHLPAYVPHRVDAVKSDGDSPAIMLLTMLTGETIVSA